jgi:hypothetical protein
MDEQNKKVGRNDPCPCGSGKKYKNCHYGQETKKTFTASGKRKFKATVLTTTDKSQSIFQGTAPAPAMPKNVKPLDYLKFRKAKADYKQEVKEEAEYVRPAEETPEAQEPTTTPELPESFKPVKKDYRKKDE